MIDDEDHILFSTVVGFIPWALLDFPGSSPLVSMEESACSSTSSSRRGHTGRSARIGDLTSVSVMANECYSLQVIVITPINIYEFDPFSSS